MLLVPEGPILQTSVFLLLAGEGLTFPKEPVYLLLEGCRLHEFFKELFAEVLVKVLVLLLGEGLLKVLVLLLGEGLVKVLVLVLGEGLLKVLDE